MDAKQPGDLPDQIICMELPLRENIGAELDDFLTLGLLGIHDEARDLAQTVLWRHLRYFPIFAEVADYAIDKSDEVLQRQLLASIRDQAIEFEDIDERALMETVTEILDPDKPLSWSWSDTKYHMLEFHQWNSAILVGVVNTISSRHSWQPLLRRVERSATPRS